MSQGSKPLVVADIAEITKSLGALSVEDLEKLRVQLCPEAEFRDEVKLEDILQYLIENESNPTGEKFKEMLKTRTVKQTEPTSSAFSALTNRISQFLSRPVGRNSGKALVIACVKGDRETVRNLLKARKGIKPNVKHLNLTPLVAASMRGHLGIVEDLVKAGADIQYKVFKPPLIVAIEGGHYEVVKYLLENGAAVDANEPTALQKAAYRGHLEVVDLLLKHGADIDKKSDVAARPALNIASAKGHYEVVKHLLDNGASVNAMDNEMCTALHEAAYFGDPKVVDLLLKHGAVIGNDPLMVAIAVGNVEVLKLLLDRGATASMDIPKGSTSLVVADTMEITKDLRPLSVEELQKLRAQLCPKAEFSDDVELKDILRYWIENESNPTKEKFLELLQTQTFEQTEPTSSASSSSTSLLSKIVDTFSGSVRVFGDRALVNACKEGDREAVRDLMKKKNVKPNVIYRDVTPLLAASLIGHLGIVKDLVKAGANVQFTCTGKAARPALNAACERGHYDVAEYLLDNGASVNAVDREMQTALHEAAFNGHSNIVDLLLKHRAVIEKQSDDGSTPLMVASAGGDVEVVQLLLDHGANASIRIPEWGRTPLHNAASRGNPDVLDLLLKSPHTHIDDQDQMGRTPLMLAICRHIYRESPDRLETLDNLLKTVKFLVGAGADPNVQESSGKTALMLAAKNNRLEDAKVLIDAGADVDIQDEEKGWSAIFFAAEQADIPMAELLCKSGASLSLFDKRKKSIYDISKRYSPSVHNMLLNPPKKESRAAGPDPCDEGKDYDHSASVARQDRDVPIPQMPSYYKYHEKYPGVCFFGDPWKQTVTSDGVQITDWGKEIGIEFDIPPGAVPKGKELELSVWPCISGPFHFPEDYDPASPVYLITPSFEFSCDINLKMYHYYVVETDEDCESMAFLAATATLPKGEGQPQYQFRVLKRSVFNPSEEYGRVSLKHFCAITTRKRKKSSRAKIKKDEKAYAVQVYTEKHFERMAIFSAFLKCPLSFEKLNRWVKETYPDSRLYTTYTRPIRLLEDKVELNWLEGGWKVIPDRKRPYEILKEEMNDDESYSYPPKIKLDVAQVSSFTGELTPIEVTVQGISEDQAFILNPKPQTKHGSAGFAARPWCQPMLSPPLAPWPTEGYRSRELSLQSSSSSSSNPFSPPLMPYSTTASQEHTHHRLPSPPYQDMGNIDIGMRQEETAGTTEQGILNSKPELGQLLKFKYRDEDGDIEEMEVIAMVATKWKLFGVGGLGLKDYKVDTCKDNDINNSCYNMFQMFLQSGSKKFRTPKWSSVVQAMRDSNFAALADELERALTHMT